MIAVVHIHGRAAGPFTVSGRDDSMLEAFRGYPRDGGGDPIVWTINQFEAIVDNYGFSVEEGDNRCDIL